MTPEQIIADLNRQLEQLTVENKELTVKSQHLKDENNRQNAEISALSSFYAEETKNMAYELYRRDITIGACTQQRHFLEYQISYIETSSIASAQASAEATAFLEKSLTDNQHLEYNLSQQTIQLQEQITKNHQLSSESDNKLREYLEKISELKSTALMNTIQCEESEKRVTTIESDIKTLSDKSRRLIKARDDLIKQLNKSNKSIQQKKSHETKKLREAHAKLSDSMDELQQKISENDRLQDSLHQDVAREALLQGQLRSTIKENEHLQRSLDFFQAEDLKQQQTISNIKRQLQDYKTGEKYKGLQQTARYKTVEIEQLKEQARRQEKELQEKDAQVTRLTASIKQSVATIRESNRTVARLKGEILAQDIPSLDNIQAEKISMSVKLADTVLEVLEGGGSGQKPADTIATVRDFLKTEDARLTYILTDLFNIRELVKDMAALANETNGAEEIETLIGDVRELTNGLKVAKPT